MIFDKKGISTLEYAAVAAILLTAFFVMRRPIARTFMGRWKTLGDSFMHGQLYDPHVTVECGRYVEYDEDAQAWGDEIWYEYRCYENCMEEKDHCPQSEAIKRRKCCAERCENAVLCDAIVVNP